MAAVNEREAALFALMDITDGGGYNNIVLKRSFEREKHLDKRQKAFVTEIVNGTLRNIIRIDYIIGKFSKTPVKKIKVMILNILRISVYQILFMSKVPPSAAVNEGVNLARKKGYQGLSGYVNGLLRTIAREKDSINYPDFETNPKENLSIVYSYPEWLIEYLSTFMENDEIKCFCEASSRSPKISICVNSLKTTKEELKTILEKEGMTVSEGRISPHCLIVSGTADLSSSKAYQEGLFHVMDEGAMAVVSACGPKPGETIYDLCAAPGGKSFYLSYLMENKGFVYASDIYEHKIALMKKGAERLGIDIMELSLSDASILKEDMKEKADCVLLDAPCSGLGLIRKKPDIKYNKSMEDIEELSKIQRKLLDAAAFYPKIGGRLIYSTCTLSKKENEDNIKYFIEKYPYELEKIPSLQGDNNGSIRLTPHEHGTDGFFIARLIRRG
ncbi:16S rRNA (cytosine(967)-C(5))-methyltransferase RsmB [Anaeropeptidivorans aminofermentans]|uniref:16S rRNA (cytosine(967)-C(5))-methyltransferase RsmB n=1 Tax=Anaeropeptidivorans aminofermentans TaxID=2934315 RepID=UPI002023CBFD|nr:16S rRNA (cytosine(967)-C(5))-methyltransferase RsmB [Anaeropeptidivorans aminofermentans]